MVGPMDVVSVASSGLEHAESTLLRRDSRSANMAAIPGGIVWWAPTGGTVRAPTGDAERAASVAAMTDDTRESSAVGPPCRLPVLVLALPVLPPVVWRERGSRVAAREPGAGERDRARVDADADMVAAASAPLARGSAAVERVGGFLGF
jgi:hypothetical protein